MNKISLIYITGIVCFTFLFSFAAAQEMGMIRAKQQNGKIIITYELLGSEEGERYFVNIWCRTPIGEHQVKSARGDIGRDVPGGKTLYQVEWDALQDVNTLTRASFLVKAEKTKSIATTDAVRDESNKPTSTYEKPLMGIVQYYGGLQDTPAGVQFNLVKKVGVFAAVRYGDGTYTDHQGPFEVPFLSFTAGLSARFVNSPYFGLIPFVGGGYGVWSLYDHDDFGVSHDLGPQAEYGLSFSMRRVIATIGAAHLLGNEFHSNFIIGIGYVLFQQ